MSRSRLLPESFLAVWAAFLRYKPSTSPVSTNCLGRGLATRSVFLSFVGQRGAIADRVMFVLVSLAISCLRRSAFPQTALHIYLHLNMTSQVNQVAAAFDPVEVENVASALDAAFEVSRCSACLLVWQCSAVSVFADRALPFVLHPLLPR